MALDIMMDTSIYPASFRVHPIRQDTRPNFGGTLNITLSPSPKYYFMEFGISRHYNPEDDRSRIQRGVGARQFLNFRIEPIRTTRVPHGRPPLGWSYFEREAGP